MFHDLGLNTARQPDNGSNPRPDNRVGWLDGQTPDVVAEHISTIEGLEDAQAFEIRLWDPSTQLKFSRKRSVPPRPDGAPNRGLDRTTREAEAARRAA